MGAGSVQMTGRSSCYGLTYSAVTFSNNPRNLRNHLIRIRAALGRIVMMDELDAVVLEPSVPSMVLSGSRGRMERFAVNFENTPLSLYGR